MHMQTKESRGRCKMDFKSKTVIRNKEGHYIIKKGPIHQEDITTVNIDTPNVETPEYIKQKLTDLKVVIDNYTVIVGEFSTPLSTMDRSCRWKIS